MTTATAASEVTLAIPDTTELAQGQVNIVELAKAFVVDSQDSLDKAGELATAAKARMKVIDGVLGPPVSKAHEAHKAAKKAWNTLTNPNEEAYDIYRKKMGDYVHEEELRAAAEQRRKADAARKIEEDRVAAEAEQLAKEDRTEEAVALLDAPITVPIPAARPVRTTSTKMSTQTNWKFRIVDRGKIPADYMTVNETLIGQIVRKQHKAAEKLIPGIEAYPETGVTMR